ncbi:radical SAM protein [Methanobrevibacter sp. DSM 116169]|uniref:radical SAM protein n=1 Tax=Methanobrevibacter sp. DSM 116169 TaxID=3242727 RepID=UPI0038FCCEC1
MILEKNTIQKDPLKTEIRIALSYPNIYKTAMSSLGFQLMYNLINEREDSWCERIVYPEKRTIESNSPLKGFNIISFSLQYEQDYFNVLKILEYSDIPLRREDRNENHPLIIAGGPCATANPLPLTDFIDLFIIGEGETTINNFLDCYKKIDNPHNNIKEFSKIEGVYVSSENNHTKINIMDNLNSIYHNTHPLIVETEDENYKPVFQNTILLNVSRGCTRGCRFCMSSYLYRPLREVSLKKLFEIAEKSRENTGFNKVTLIGSAVGDYSKLNELIKGLKNRNFEVSTPSLRLESLNRKTLENLKNSGLRTLTIAPESIYSLRKSINKDISNEKIEEVVKNAIDLKLKIKFYFLIGLPNEGEEEIKELCEYITKLNSYGNTHLMSFSINPTIPKPHTPLQWDTYNIKDIKSKIKYLKKNLKNIDVKFDSAKMGLIQYILSCGDHNVGNLLEKSLHEKIPIKEWEKYIPNYDFNSHLPWENIDIGLNSNFLKKEREKIDLNKTTPWCKENKCYKCGVCNK